MWIRGRSIFRRNLLNIQEKFVSKVVGCDGIKNMVQCLNCAKRAIFHPLNHRYPEAIDKRQEEPDCFLGPRRRMHLVVRGFNSVLTFKYKI